jgi:uncharacterized membrane protein
MQVDIFAVSVYNYASVYFLNKNKMFKKHAFKNMWLVMIILIALVAIILIMQTQVIMMLQDLKASIFGGWIMDVNPLPPAKDWLMDVNPLPPREFVQDVNPLPPALFR